jgi:hypothetical protein
MKKPSKKLSFKREVLTVLLARELSTVVGGATAAGCSGGEIVPPPRTYGCTLLIPTFK